MIKGVGFPLGDIEGGYWGQPICEVNGEVSQGGMKNMNKMKKLARGWGEVSSLTGYERGPERTQ